MTPHRIQVGLKNGSIRSRYDRGYFRSQTDHIFLKALGEQMRYQSFRATSAPAQSLSPLLSDLLHTHEWWREINVTHHTQCCDRTARNVWYQEWPNITIWNKWSSGLIAQYQKSEILLLRLNSYLVESTVLHPPRKRKKHTHTCTERVLPVLLIMDDNAPARTANVDKMVRRPKVGNPHSATNRLTNRAQPDPSVCVLYKL